MQVRSIVGSNMANPRAFLRKAELLLRSIRLLRNSDQLLVGFPKTGTTWVRYFLYRLLIQDSSLSDTSIDAMNDVMPEFGHRSMTHPWPFEETSRIVKTHHRGWALFHGNNSLLIVRDPRDVMISYHRYLKGLRSVSFSVDLKTMLRHERLGMRAFLKHYESWRDKASLIVRYEDLLIAPTLWFSKISKSLRIERTPDEIKQAVDDSSFQSMRRAQSSSQRLQQEFKEGHEFLRSGTSKQWGAYFDDDDLAFCRRTFQEFSFHLYED